MAQLVTFHAPDDLLIGLCVSAEERPRWEWVKWLPHAQHPTKTDAVGPVRLFAPTITGLEAMFDDVLASRLRFNPATAGASPGAHVMIVIDGGSTAGSDYLMTEAGVEGVTIIDLSNPPPRLLGDAMVVLDIGADGSVSGSTM